MSITNIYNLPNALENYVRESEERHEIKPNEYSATELLSSTKEILLSRRHSNEIKVDVADMIQALFGTAVHKLLENHTTEGLAELKLDYTFKNGIKLTGICDNYSPDNNLIIDYKTCKVGKVVKQDFDDWKKQLLIYAWLLLKKGYFTEKIKIIALLKDWTYARVGSAGYPEKAVYIWEYNVKTQDYTEIEEFITDKINALYTNSTKADSELPDCSKEEKWYSGDEYAVYKDKDSKRALKVFSNKEDAEQFATEKEAKHIEFRKGENVKCNHFCSCYDYCKLLKEVKND